MVSRKSLAIAVGLAVTAVLATLWLLGPLKTTLAWPWNSNYVRHVNLSKLPVKVVELYGLKWEGAPCKDVEGQWNVRYVIPLNSTYITPDTHVYIGLNAKAGDVLRYIIYSPREVTIIGIPGKCSYLTVYSRVNLLINVTQIIVSDSPKRCIEKWIVNITGPFGTIVKVFTADTSVEPGKTITLIRKPIRVDVYVREPWAVPLVTGAGVDAAIWRPSKNTTLIIIPLKLR